VVLVLSKSDNVAQRNAIRETWASEVGDDSVVLFVLGKGGDKSLLRHEVKQFDDLLFVEVRDRYESLTAKVLQAFEQVGTRNQDVELRFTVFFLFLGFKALQLSVFAEVRRRLFCQTFSYQI
jgi:Galactosyltransferase